MRTIATFDIGTTAVKAVLVDESGTALFSASREIPTLSTDGYMEQDPHDWWAAFQALSRELLAVGTPSAICMSGQMQDVIALDGDLDPLRNAILYSDNRARVEAKALARQVGARRIAEITGNPFDGSIPLSKFLWLRDHEPEVFERTRCFLISSKDYVIARLTGLCAGDRTACSTAGCMDIATGQWSGELLAAAGIDPARLPRLYAAHEKVGGVTAAAAALTGYPEGTPVYAGAGDAGATSLASGLAEPGQYNINLGTSGWVAAASANVLPGEGVFNLAAMPEGRLINIVPFLNGASVHRWLSALNSDMDAPDYAKVDAQLRSSPPGARGVMALPYLVGERFPVPDSSARGSFVGLTPSTTLADMSRAMLESVAFSIRRGLEQMPCAPTQVSLIGGGARVEPWCQIMADVLGQRVRVFRDAGHLPARAIAAAALIGEGRLDGYDAFVQSILTGQSATFQPDPEAHALYNHLYQKHVHLYEALRGWYERP